MLLTLVITLLLVGAAVIGSIYSNFLTFFSNFAETENYNKAYYASIAAIERAELVIKQRAPGYTGSGGRKSDLNKSTGTIRLSYTGSVSQGDSSDGVIEANLFSYLSSGNSRGTNVFWAIESRAKQVPEEGKGNIDWMLITGDSANYNMMDYENSEVFLLYYDTSSGNPYNSGTIQKSDLSQITGTIRLSPYLYKAFKNNIPTDFNNLLDEGKSLSITGVTDDAIIDWQVRGKYPNAGTEQQFTIYSSQDIQYKKPTKKDTAIRESNINKGVDLEFGKNSWNPIANSTNRSMGEITIISPYEDLIRTEASPQDKKYKTVFENGTNLQLRLSLLNLLQTKTRGMIYPFLEYKLNFGTDISAKYFKIDGEGKFDDFQVNTIIHRPTNKESVLGDFTVIF